MNRRFLALLLALCIALQSLVPTLTQAQADDTAVATHCAESAMPASHGDHAQADLAEEPGCPHCDHSGTSHTGCASQCLFAMALLPAAATFIIPSSTSPIEAAPLPALTRFDIPPTPPPIH